MKLQGISLSVPNKQTKKKKEEEEKKRSSFSSLLWLWTNMAAVARIIYKNLTQAHRKVYSIACLNILLLYKKETILQICYKSKHQL